MAQPLRGHGWSIPDRFVPCRSPCHTGSSESMAECNPCGCCPRMRDGCCTRTCCRQGMLRGGATALSGCKRARCSSFASCHRARC